MIYLFCEQATFSETLAGVPTIRAFDVIPHFIAVCDERINQNTRVVHHLITIQRWLG